MNRLAEEARAAGYRLGPSAGGLSWDWPGIFTMEARARAIGRKLPRCRICGKPLWGHQHEVHMTCSDAGRKGV